MSFETIHAIVKSYLTIYTIVFCIELAVPLEVFVFGYDLVTNTRIHLTRFQPNNVGFRFINYISGYETKNTTL